MMNMNMGNFGNKIAERFFKRVDNVVWDLMTGKVGIKTSDGIATLEGEGDEAQVKVNLFDDFGIALPAFAQNTPVEQIKKGDLIFRQNDSGWVVSVPAEGKKTFVLLKPNGNRSEWRPPLVASLGLDMSGAMVLRNLMNILPGGDLSGMQGMLLPMMMMGNTGEGDMEKMLPMMLMMQTGAAGNPAGGMGNMLPMMMMMKMFGGDKGGSKKGGGFFDKED